MSKKSPTSSRLDVKVFLRDSLLQPDKLAGLQMLLRRVAPSWSEAMQIRNDDGTNTPVSGAEPRDFETSVTASALRLGPRYRELVTRAGAGPYTRKKGVVELRGADSSLVVVISMDEWTFAPSGPDWVFANTLALQANGPRIEARAAAQWAAEAFHLLCNGLSPMWGKAHLIDEYGSKNISREGGGMQAIGIDASRSLPGLYWMNFFGREYCELIGRERLLTCPAAEVAEADEGVVVRLAEAPGDWNTDEYRRQEAVVIDHLGPEFFFDRREPGRPSKAPPFELPVVRA